MYSPGCGSVIHAYSPFYRTMIDKRTESNNPSSSRVYYRIGCFYVTVMARTRGFNGAEQSDHSSRSPKSAILLISKSL